MKPRAVPANFDLQWVRTRLAAHQPMGLRMGEPLGPDVHARARGAVLSSRAAVAAILRDAQGGPEVLLIRRAEHPGDPWSGHMAFPGGREEPHDASLVGTALRETSEEIGWDLRELGEQIGRLDDLPAVAGGRSTGLLITPFVFQVREVPPVVVNAEVAEVLWAPLAPMMRGELAAEVPYRLGGVSMKLPAHDVSGRVVWGLTYGMLERLFAVLSGS